MASKRQELQDMLVNRLSKRYGDRATGAEELIVKEVQKLLHCNSSKKVTQEELRHLERKVDRETMRLLERQKEAEVVAKDMERRKSTMSSSGVDEENPPIPLNNYLVFNTAKEIQYQRDELKKKRLKHEKQMEMKRELDEQVNRSKERFKVDQDIESKYANHVKALHEEWIKEERAAKEKLRKKNMTVKEERDVQLQQIQARRERIRLKNRREEEQMIEKAKKELELEEKKKRQQVLDQQQYMLKVQHENAKIKEMREQLKRKEQEEDKRLQREYAARLDEQERIRKETFEKMKEKSTNNQKMYILATEEKNRQEKEDEERALRYQTQKLEEDERKAKEDIRKKLKNKQMMNEILAKQVEDFNRKKNSDAEAEKEFAIRFKAEAEKAIEDERLAQVKRRQQALKHKLELQKQIEWKKNAPRDTDSAIMTEYEMQINRVNMLQLCKDKEIVDAVSERLARQKAAIEGRHSRRHAEDYEM